LTDWFSISCRNASEYYQSWCWYC